MATITKRGDTWRIRCSLGYDSQGKQVIRSTTWKPDPGMTPKQAEKELNRFAVLFEEKCKSGRGDPHITFEKLAEKWFAEYAKSHLKAKTYHEYRGMTARTYQALGHIKADRLRPRHFREFFAQLAEPGMNQITGKALAPKNIWNYYSFCSSVMGWAVKSELIDRNPCTAAAPKKPASHIVCLDDEQARQFLEALEKEPLEDRVFFTLALLTGYRRGELLGLEWQDVDFDAGVITVRRTSQYTNDRGIYTDTPKTASSARSTKISPALVELLRSYKVAQATARLERGDLWSSEWADHPRLFTALDGTPLQPNLPGKRLHKILERAGLPQVTLHSLRHTNASLLITGGVDVRTVAARLGHSQTSTTLNIYAETIKNAEAAAAQVLDDILLKKA